MSLLQLSPTLPLSTPKGAGQAWFLIDYGPEHHLIYVVAIDATGELWSFDNTQVRAQKNITMGRLLNKGNDHEARKTRTRQDD